MHNFFVIAKLKITNEIGKRSSVYGSEKGLTPGLLRRVGESESEGKGAEECGSNLMK
jgi:hypothetical protein